MKKEEDCWALPPYPLNPADQKTLDHEMQHWTNNNLMHWRQQNNPNHVLLHASPAFVVHKELGMIVKSSVVKDFRLLNANAYDYVHDNLTIDEMHTSLAGSRFINATDVEKWFYHIPLEKESQKDAGIRVKGCALVPTLAMQGTKNSPIYANQISSETLEDLAYCMQADLNQALKHARS